MDTSPPLNRLDSLKTAPKPGSATYSPSPGCTTVTGMSAILTSLPEHPRLLRVVVLGDRLVETLQRRAVAREIARLLRVAGRAHRRLDILECGGLGRRQ